VPLHTLILDSSPYLSRLSDSYTASEPEDLIVGAAECDTPEALKALKARFVLSWSNLAISGAAFDRLAALQTRFAEVTISAALRMAWAEASARLRIDTPLAGLFVLGLGKLGGGDLNFSSDVDLVAFYDSATFPVPEHRGQSYEAGRILKGMSAILQPRNDPDFIWRLDWRLRPEASVQGLAMEVAAARDFYFFRALPWHRLAMIKARPVAGDVKAGEAFLDTLAPYLWRRNLDFRALDELAGIKSRINLEHPGLRAERAQQAPITDDPSGFNVKLGAGGIREIEFIANAAQLIWGGKQPGLRVPNTLDALKRLGDLGHYDNIGELSRIYKRLRRLENAVQMRGNEHTHIIPDGEALQEIVTLSGDDMDGLDADRHYIREHFKAIFGEDTPPPLKLPRYVRNLRGETLAIAENWLAGFTRYGIRKSVPTEMLATELFWRVSASGLEPAEAIARLDRFFATLSRSEQYIRLLAEHPTVLDPLVTPLLHSPHMASLLEMSPHIIDVFITPETGLDTEFIFASDDFETRLESLRRFVNEHLYQGYYQLMSERITAADLQYHLTAVAEAALEAALRITADDLGLETLPIAVIGLGKLGTRAMMPLSDMDLLFLFPDEVDGELSARIVRKLRTVLTVRLSEGIVYELDMRLRPSGRSGPPAVKWSSFVEHHETRAKNWEHVALTTARFICGDAALGAKAEAFISVILSQPRDKDQLRGDCARMWARLSDQRVRKTPARLFDARLREGGLLQAEFTRNARTLLGQREGRLTVALRYFADQLVWERLLGLTLKVEVSERFAQRVPTGKTGVIAADVMAVTDATFAGADPSGEDTSVTWL